MFKEYATNSYPFSLNTKLLREGNMKNVQTNDPLGRNISILAIFFPERMEIHNSTSLWKVWMDGRTDTMSETSEHVLGLVL